MKSFSDFSTELLKLKTQLEGKQEEIANVAGDGAVNMNPTGRSKKLIRRKKTFSVSPQVFDMFRRGKKKFEKWSKYLNLEDESQKAIYSWAIRNHTGVLILQNAVTGEVSKKINKNPRDTPMAKLEPVPPLLFIEDTERAIRVRTKHDKGIVLLIPVKAARGGRSGVSEV